ncbi:hypothetical protein ALC53_01597 [Atta colombica]|uniref:Uncharacterized protein n=1 Tax=Atta colombica TaxID=520822 RepID=A0A195BV27_9HYME|nr:hypothetical protein ALC53_01597 [Atta colombica]
MEKSAAEAHRMLSNTYGEAAISERLGTSAVSTLLKLQGVKDSRAVRKLDERKARRIRPLSTMKSDDDYIELDCDLKCIMKETVLHSHQVRVDEVEKAESQNGCERELLVGERKVPGRRANGRKREFNQRKYSAETKRLNANVKEWHHRSDNYIDIQNL